MGRKQSLTYEDVRQVYERYGSSLVAYACSILADKTAAEDVVHQVFLKLLSTPALSPGESKPYLFRAVRNTALNRIRSEARTTSLDLLQGWFEAPSTKTESALALEAAVRKLPTEQREVVMLHLWSEMTFEEIAALLEISANTAASRYRYGLARLRAELRPEDLR